MPPLGPLRPPGPPGRAASWAGGRPRNPGVLCCRFQKINAALTRADAFLLEGAPSARSTFTLAIAAYALSLGDRTHPQFYSIVSGLKRKALVKGTARSCPRRR